MAARATLSDSVNAIDSGVQGQEAVLAHASQTPLSLWSEVDSAYDDLFLWTFCAWLQFYVRDAPDYVKTLKDIAEDCVPAVPFRVVCERYEELAGRTVDVVALARSSDNSGQKSHTVE